MAADVTLPICLELQNNFWPNQRETHKNKKFPHNHTHKSLYNKIYKYIDIYRYSYLYEMMTFFLYYSNENFYFYPTSNTKSYNQDLWISRNNNLSIYLQILRVIDNLWVQTKLLVIKIYRLDALWGAYYLSVLT